MAGWREQVRRARDARGLSNVRLALLANVPRPSLIRALRPNSNPTMRTVERLANALGLVLVIGTEERKP